MSHITSKNNKKVVELLAPAGSFESLRAAIINGADAVYLGLNAFNARNQASNFTLESLKDAVRLCHLFGVKVYLTLNIILKDSELESAVELAKKAWDIGVSAVILQDISLAQMLKQRYPQIVLHASTQMGIHNSLGAQAARKMGIERIILSRETPLAEIKNIRDNCDIEIEHFVHGSLCCSFSGSCYFSSLVSGKSGNRGRCLQLCRKRYELRGGEKTDNGFWLSTKDTMLANSLNELIDAGVCSFKIEGRMRRSEYAAEVTRVYRKAIDAKIDSSDIDALKLMYNRGNFANAHLFGVESDIIYQVLQNHMGLKIGRVESVSGAKAKLTAKVSKGDGIKFVSKKGESGHALVLADGFETGFVGSVQRGDEVYLTDCAKKNEEIGRRTRKLPIVIFASFSLKDKSADITLCCGKVQKIYNYSLNLEVPKSSPLTKDDIAECLTALGDTHFECRNISIECDDAFFLPKSALKSLRRDIVADFENHIIEAFDRPLAANTSKAGDYLGSLTQLKTDESCAIIMCDCSQIEDYKSFADFLVIKPTDYKKLLDDINSNHFTTNEKYILDLPVTAISSDIELLKEIIKTDTFDKYMVNNTYALELVSNSQIILGYKMNLLNNQLDFARVSSIEQRNDCQNNFTYVFGRPDIMQYVHCYYKLQRGCRECHDKTPLTLTDDKGEIYEIKRQKLANCYNTLISSVAINLTDKGYKKRFIDVTSITDQQKQSLLEYLKGSKASVENAKYLQYKFLD